MSVPPAGLERFSTHEGVGLPPSIRAMDLFGRPNAKITLPLNRKTTEQAIVPTRLDRLEPNQDFITVGGLSAYVRKSRRDPPDVAHIVYADGRERWIVQEGHTRIGAALLRGESVRDCRVWEFREGERGDLVPVVRGLHRYGQRRGGFTLSYRETLALRAGQALPVGDASVLALGGPGSGNFGHAGRPGEVGGSAAGDSQPRAKAGGEIGPNGDWYPGGAFIATTDLPKLERRKLEKIAGSDTVAVDIGRREKISPDQIPIFREVGAALNRDFTINEQYLEYLQRHGSDEAYATQLREASKRAQRGERLLDIKEFPALARVSDVARLIVAGQPVPGDALDRAKMMRPDLDDYLTRYTPRKDLGGPGSGNFGHAGRPGEVGGSGPGGGSAKEYSDKPWPYAEGAERPHELTNDAEVKVASKYAEWAENLPALRKSAITNYTANAYYPFNEALRTGKFEDVTQLDVEDMERLQKVLIDAPTDGLPDVVWRGVGEHRSKLVASLKPGDEITLKGFQSTTISPEVAFNVTPMSTGPKDTPDVRTVFEIRPARGAYVAPMSAFKHEKEFLLPHGAKYKVVGTEMSGWFGQPDAHKYPMSQRTGTVPLPIPTRIIKLEMSRDTPDPIDVPDDQVPRFDATPRFDNSDWNESLHPRDESGRFTDGGGSSDDSASRAPWPYKNGQRRIAQESWKVVGDYAAWSKDLSHEEKRSFGAYTTSDHHDINRFLRGDPVFKVNHDAAARMKQDIKRIDAALDAAPAPAPGTVVWRGVKTEELPSMAVGDTIRLNGYQSATINANVAHSFTSDLGTRVILEIRPIKGAYIAPMSFMSGEEEFLLPHGHDYRVIGTDKAKFGSFGADVNVIQLQQLPKSRPKTATTRTATKHKKPIAAMSYREKLLSLADWDESLHPRDESGKFTNGGTGSTSSTSSSSSSQWPFTPGSDRPSKLDQPREDALKHRYSDWASRLTDDDASKLKGYTDFDYGDVNRMLRGEKLVMDTGESYQQQLQQQIHALDRVIATAPTPPSDLIVWRALDGNKMGEVLRSLKSGDTLQLRGFQSSSIDPNMMIGANNVLEIRPTGGAFIAPQSKYPEEHEFLLPRDRSYRVVGVEEAKVGGQFITNASGRREAKVRHVIKLEMLPEKPSTIKFSYREKLSVLALGGPGSGNFGHAGRPGQVGGSGEGEGSSSGQETKKAVESWVSEMKAKHPAIETLVVRLNPYTDTIKMDLFVVSNAARSKGLGSEVMRALTALADKHVKRIGLSPSGKDAQLGTTSRARLVKFYKQFGFVENKGIHFEELAGGTMYRNPKPSKDLRTVHLGGPGSGNFGHAGRPGEVGGSGPGGGSTARPQFTSLVNQIKQPDGGFTVHAATGKVPTTGYAVSIYKGREKVVPAQSLTLKDLVTFSAQNADLLGEANNFFGAWHNPADGQVYMDVSKVVDSPAEAEKLGQDFDQIAYFDLAHGKSIETPPKLSAKEAERVLDKVLGGPRADRAVRKRANIDTLLKVSDADLSELERAYVAIERESRKTSFPLQRVREELASRRKAQH